MAIQLYLRLDCPVCGNGTVKTLYETPFSDPQLRQFLLEFYRGRAKLDSLADEKYQISKCQRCGFIYQTNVLNEDGMLALYSEWVDAKKSLQKKQTAKARLFKQYARQIEILSWLFKQPPRQVKVLEYGMGWGYWSRMAQAFGFDVRGLELSPERAAHARSLGVEVIDRLPGDESQFHFIYANQVFEHLPAPLETLQQLAAQLKPDGVVYLRVPDGRDVEKRLRHSGWSPDLDAIHPLEHINCFTRSTLRHLASNAGLEPLQPPLRLNLGSLWGGIKREFSDRFLTTHIFFRKQ
ncbi:MAG: class I SAM-dependent methyltransferase [Gammaproteobacteria bacterium]